MTFFSNATWSVWSALGLFLGAPLGAALYHLVQQRIARERRRIPVRWPLAGRLVANSKEQKVWRWLASNFFDHAVMIKMPVTRFMLPTSHDQRMQWFELLGGVYCTFTVVSLDGRVIGCIDVSVPDRQTRNNRKLKQSLLQQCGVPYLVLDPADLPSLAAIRAEFLGAAGSTAAVYYGNQLAIQQASHDLRSSLTEKRRTRKSDFGSLNSVSGDQGMAMERDGEPSQFAASGWQENSFLAPFDSRRDTLR